MVKFSAKSASDFDMREAVNEARTHFRNTGERCYAVAFGVLLWHSDRA